MKTLIWKHTWIIKKTTNQHHEWILNKNIQGNNFNSKETSEAVNIIQTNKPEIFDKDEDDSSCSDEDNLNDDDDYSDDNSNAPQYAQFYDGVSRRWICPNCHFDSHQRSILRNHMLNDHQIEIGKLPPGRPSDTKLVKISKKKYPCPICDKSLSSKQYLMKHIENVHSKINITTNDNSVLEKEPMETSQLTLTETSNSISTITSISNCESVNLGKTVKCTICDKQLEGSGFDMLAHAAEHLT